MMQGLYESDIIIVYLFQVRKYTGVDFVSIHQGLPETCVTM